MTQDNTDVEPVKTYQPFEFDGQAVAEEIAKILNDVAKHSGSEERFKGSFEAPDLAEIKECQERNCTVMATIILSHKSNAESAFESIPIPVPYPYNGVFVIGNGNGRLRRPKQAKLMVWHPHLQRSPGLWFLRDYNDNGIRKAENTEIRLFCGHTIPTSNQKKKIKGGKKVHSFFSVSTLNSILDLCNKAGLNDLKVLIGKNILIGSNLKKKINLQLKKIDEQLISKLIENVTYYDKQDLTTQHLFTYNAFLIQHATNYICNSWLEDDGKYCHSYWENSKHTLGLQIADNLRMKVMKSGEGKYNYLMTFEPENAAAAISALTSFARYKPVALDTFPAACRQNHPSYFQRVCPVQTPESGKIGLSLNLAADAKVDVYGQIYQSNNADGLGYVAAMIPFYHHTDSARAMLGAKNYVQALVLKDSEPPLITTGMENRVEKVLEPLANSGLLSLRPYATHPGRNLVVAYMPFYGLNYNDAIVVSKSAAAKLFAQRHIPAKWRYIDPEFTESEPSTDMMAGSIVDDFLQGQTDSPFHAESGSLIPLGLGDKLTGRHGNKGVISAILSDDEMPRLPKDPRLGVISGQAVDIILNPLGVISRMNVSQLLESHAGLLKLLGVTLKDETGKPFKATRPEDIQQLYDDVNGDSDSPVIDKLGRINLTFRNRSKREETVTVPVVIGAQYIIRLDHIPGDKANYRGREDKDHINIYDYDPITWQARKGKKARGGQRLGHMEMWALEAYQASELMRYFLTDAIRPKFPTSTDKEHSSGEDVSQTFRAIRDFLFAMFIVLEEINGAYQLRWAREEEITARGKQLTMTEGDHIPATKRAIRGAFKCGHPGCKYELAPELEGSEFDDHSGIAYLTVGDFLRVNNVAFKTCSYNKNIPLLSSKKLGVESNSPKVSVLRIDSRLVKVTVHLNTDNFIYAYRREPNEKLSLIEILGMKICCKQHRTTNFMKCTITAGTPCSVKMFGSLADPAVFSNDVFDWGYICLTKPITVPPPKEEKEKKKKKKKKEDKKDSKKSAAKYSVLPILPWTYRKSLDRMDSQPVVSKLTELYEAVIDPKSKKIETCFKKLFDHLKSTITGKQGLLRRDGTGRILDHSGRLVCVPDPSIAWDECGFSSDVLGVLFQFDDHLQSLAKEQGNCEKSTNYLRAKNYYVLVNRPPTLHKYNIKALRPVCISSQLNTTSLVIAVNPLISSSMGLDWDGDELSFHVVRDESGILNDDLDKLLPTSARNLLSVATGNKKPVTEFDQDLVLGTFLIGRDAMLRNRFTKEVLSDTCPFCREQVLMAHVWDTNVCHKFQCHIIEKHIDDACKRLQAWMRMAFEAVTISGVTFGYFDLLACMDDLPKKITEKGQKADDRNTAMDISAKQHVATMILDRSHLDDPGFSVAAMVCSEARGDKQIRQLIMSRGYLDPGTTRFNFEENNFLFTENLVEGMSCPEQSFYAAMNGRSTMTAKKLDTAKAGSLTNKLVAMCWPWRIKTGDCGSKDLPRSLTMCRLLPEQKICSKCYGLLNDGTTPEDGYPLGLIAAQSIGERGTQLAMKSFHTGQMAVNIGKVKELLAGRDGSKNQAGAKGEAPVFTDSKESLDKFVTAMLEFKVYSHIDPRHFQLIWKIIVNSSNDIDLACLETAIAKECGDDLFGALASPSTQWRSIMNAIKRKIRTESPYKQNLIAKLMMGYAGQIEIDVERTSRSDNSESDEKSDAETFKAFKALDNKEDDDEMAESLDDDEEELSDGSETAENKEENTDDDDDDDSEVSNNPNPRVSDDIIAVILAKNQDKLKCYVETNLRSELNSKQISLARKFVAWLEVQQIFSCDHFEARSWMPFFDSHEHFFKTIDPTADYSTNIESDVSKFLKRAIIYGIDFYFPVKMIFKQKTHSWSLGCPARPKKPSGSPERFTSEDRERKFDAAFADTGHENNNYYGGRYDF